MNNTFIKLSLEELVDITGNTDEWFEDNFELINGYYRRKDQVQPVK